MRGGFGYVRAHATRDNAVVIDYEAATDAELTPLLAMGTVENVRDVLRAIACPKPEEPLGLGAVVEDDKGDVWVHDRDANPGYLGVEWLNVRTRQHIKHARIAAVKVLSEGVTP